MPQASAFDSVEHLPDPLPPDPFPLFRSWFDEAHARKAQPNPNAMALATSDRDGAPSARMVLCKGIDDAGFIVFYTNYESRKARALEVRPRAAALFHWDALDRQVRIEGLVVRSPASESDAYFATRPWQSRIGAWASRQSAPLASRQHLLDRIGEVIFELGLDLSGALDEGSPGPVVPRPPFWGGYRIWADRVELWAGSPTRIHDRAAWTRSLSPGGEHAFTVSGWSSTRLQP